MQVEDALERNEAGAAVKTQEQIDSEKESFLEIHERVSKLKKSFEHCNNGVEKGWE